MSFSSKSASRTRASSSGPSSASSSSSLSGGCSTESSLDVIRSQLKQAQGTLATLVAKKKDADEYITKLHAYNDIKDVVQMLMGRLAELEGVTTKDMYKRFDLDLSD
eukprot:TRINITY_DN11136_c0_g1_i1.p2 TRINITY_DN11136_c0_g1~~TRINITY_DN11136_c0_g1_i1.p2  ORF type:complete len:107 (+),score=40.13 TRINITY_DN11136_c0_g1_i1:540-860(+)